MDRFKATFFFISAIFLSGCLSTNKNFKNAGLPYFFNHQYTVNANKANTFKRINTQLGSFAPTFLVKSYSEKRGIIKFTGKFTNSLNDTSSKIPYTVYLLKRDNFDFIILDTLSLDTSNYNISIIAKNCNKKYLMIFDENSYGFPVYELCGFRKFYNRKDIENFYEIP